MKKYIIIEDTRFLPCGGIEEVCEFDTPEEAEEYLFTKFWYIEWEHEMHRILFIVEREADEMSDWVNNNLDDEFVCETYGIDPELGV